MSILSTLFKLWFELVKLSTDLQPLAQLAARCVVAEAFFAAGRTKLADWETTLLLFENEYQVPLLPPELAAYAATAGELVLPVLLVFGLGGRFAAGGLSVINVVAVLSLSEIAPAALQQHVFWGSLLALVVLWGPGPLSLDRFITPRLRRWLGMAPETAATRIN